MRRIPPYRWLAALPALCILVGAPFANRLHPTVLGLPFLLFWIVGCVVLTSLIMALIRWLDDARAPRSGMPAPPAGDSAAEHRR